MKSFVVAKSAGFCFGVKRAVDMALSLAGSRVCTLGPLLHNKQVVAKLEALGIKAVNSVEDIPGGHAVIIRSHGVDLETHRALIERGLEIHDATCPCVKRIHEIVSAESERGGLVLLFGDRGHPEVTATASYAENATVFSSADELEELLKTNPELADKRLIMVSQTTASRNEWDKCVKISKKLCTNAEILDTICNATNFRLKEALELSSRCDLLVVVGDRGSANTRGLAMASPKAALIESAGELDCAGLAGYERVAVTAGASTPPETIEEVVLKMTEEINATNTPVEEAGSGESFAELLEQSIKTLNTGDKVKGVVTAITPTEIHVELGTKHAAYIPLDELTDDPEIKAEELVKIGEEIETFVVRVNDVEGTVKLSKKKLDTVKSWEDVENALDTNVILEGIVKEENKGGVVVSVKGVRVFVPSSQTGLPKDAPMSAIMNTKVKLRITEFNRARRRVVGSIRSVQQETRRANAENIWSTIEVGRKYGGIVKSLTSYGAFVDIGGVDGMVHVSELSWNRVRQPSDILKPGDKLDVYVLSFDPEKKKISLGHRRPEDNPWNRFTASFKVGDTVSVKVVKLMPFGAFAEVMPGVDGLIHISQLSDHRIGKPADAVSEGDTVTVKITDIDMERQKISLSIRALIEEIEPESIPEGPDEIVAIAEEGKTLIATDIEETE